MKTLHLQDYNIFITSEDETRKAALKGLLTAGNYSKIAVLTDANTRRLCLPTLLKGIDNEVITIEIPVGEQHKNIDTCRFVWEEMMRHRLDRRSLLINLGGGVIGDLGGFCAATYMRGIDFVQVPTTLLSQVDASIGGKLGIDFLSVKNNIGVFKNPVAVIIEPAFLKTLPERELLSGFAEIVKHALIADAQLWQQLQSIEDLRQVDWASLLLPSLEIKKRIVEADPFEQGIRKALNFGHTVGHALESFSFTTENPLTHGEAVALGMLCESWLSHETGLLPAKELAQITAFIQRFFPAYSLKIKDLDAVFEFMAGDKKNIGGRLNFTLLDGIGSAVIDRYCERALVRESIQQQILRENMPTEI